MAVLSVGQCGFDDSILLRVMQQELGAALERAASAEEARQMMAKQKYDLVLVNRVFDADGDSGIAFIETVKKSGEKTPMMLVSNYADAQAEAVAAGALMGFGKGALGSAEAGEILRKAAAVASRGKAV